jgi:DNA-directed RNA polymerase specialized sigma24 family protein
VSPPVAATLDVAELLAADARRKPPFIARRLLHFCLSRTRNKQRAEDVVSEAIVLTLAGDGWHRWVHDGATAPEVSLLRHLVNQAKDVMKKERERASTWREVHGDGDDASDAEDVGSVPGERSPSSEKHATNMKRVEMVLEQLDEEARQVLYVEAESDEELEPKHVAEKLGLTVRQVHRARERVFYRRDVLVAREAQRSASKSGGAA